jgi:hypothetical protein
MSVPFSSFMHDMFFEAVRSLLDKAKDMSLIIPMVRFQEKLEKEAKLYLDRLKVIDEEASTDEEKAKKKLELLMCESVLSPCIEFSKLENVGLTGKEVILLKPFIVGFPAE